MTNETLKQMLQHFIADENEEAEKCLSAAIKQKTQEIVSNMNPSSKSAEELSNRDSGSEPTS